METLSKPDVQPEVQSTARTESDHLIQTLIKKENLNVVSTVPDKQISSDQLFMVDCRVSTPQQVQDWYVAKPKGTPYLLLSPEEEHLAKMASVSIISPTEAEYAVLYETTTDDKVCVTVLGYVPVSENVITNTKFEPAADSFTTKFFMKAVCRSLEGPATLNVSATPNDPPEGLICQCPAAQIIKPAYTVTFATSREPFEGGMANNRSPTNFVAYYTPYLFLQQLNDGQDNSQILIIQTTWDIEAGDLYANSDHDRGNAQCNMIGTLQPDTKSSFCASEPPNDFSPKTSDHGSFEASIDERIYYYDSHSQQTLSYEFTASQAYDIVDWAVSSNSTDTALGPNFYATQPTNCKNTPSAPDGFDFGSDVHSLPPASCSNGELTFYTYSSWQTQGDLVPGPLTINSKWIAKVYRWYSEKHAFYKQECIYPADYHINQSFSVDFTTIQPPSV